MRSIGIIQVLLSGFCFGFLGILGKAAYTKGLTPGELLSLRFFSAGSLVFVFLALRRRFRLSRPQFVWSIILGALGYAVFSFCYFRALSGLSVSLTVLLLYMYPVMVAIGGWIFLGDRIPRERWFVLPLAMVGLVLLVWGEFYVRNASSLAFGIASAVFYAVYILCSSRFLAGSDSLTSAAVMQISAGVALGLATWRDADRLQTVIVSAWPQVLALAIVCSIAAMSLFLAGLQKLKSWEVSILSTAEPVTSIAVAYLLLDERLSAMQILGAVFVLSAFVFVSLPSKGLQNG